MIESANLLLFISISFAIIAIPGPAILYIITQSMQHGYKAGMTAVTGITFGSMVHIFAATLGVSAILVASPLAFNVLKLVGVLYLFYLAGQAIGVFSTDQKESVTQSQKVASQTIFGQSFLLSILSPQKAIFFLTTVPELVHPQTTYVALSVLGLGMIFLLMSVVLNAAYVFLSIKTNYLIGQGMGSKVFQRYLSGSVYVVLGFVIIFAV